MANSTLSSIVENTTSIANAVAFEATTLLNNLTSAASISWNETENATETLQQPFVPDDDGTHKSTELKYFSTVIIIFIGLTILIVPVFCFVGFVCARARIFKTVREAAVKGWGFADVGVPYTEFGDEYPKDKPANPNCDVKVLVVDDNTVPPSSSPIADRRSQNHGNGGRSSRRGSFLKTHIEDEEEDISSLPATFVVNNPV